MPLYNHKWQLHVLIILNVQNKKEVYAIVQTLSIEISGMIA